MTDQITPNDELIQLVKDGQFFYFCIAFALNLGHKDAIKEKKEVKFSVGGYDVEFKPSEMCFLFTHKVYIARIISTYWDGETHFVGDDENEVINEVLTELQKELTETKS